MPTPRPRLAAAVLAALVLLVAACSSDDEGSDATTTTAPGGDAAPSAPGEEGGATGVEDLEQWTERGPYGVGSQQLALADGRRVVVWYPAEEGAGTEEPVETFDIASLLNPDLQAQIPAEMRVQYPIPAAPGAEPDASGGPYPVVLFSHGFAGFPEQSADLVTHLASWGYVVAAPDHVERSLSGLLGTAAQGVAEREDVDVLDETLDLVVAQGDDDASPLSGLVDAEQVAVAGHSAGAGAAYRMASSDDRIDAVATYSVGTGGDEGLPEAPDVPALVMLGERDGIIPPEATREVYEGLSAPRYLVEVPDSGHLVFSDLCLIGAEQGGLIGIVEAIELPIPDDLKALGSDGCDTAEYLPADEAFPSIDSLSIAFLDGYLRGDAAAVDALAAWPEDGLPGQPPVTLTVDA
ncbi:dienelactone hydrolase family protein [Iamia majanohamensis]|uniref:Dienelactone hydrolase family protein n=1 Tax=Iamia majanohamensis TaxID=467976 RepID=A0AAE9YBW4_9ACTN|nr:dienelactone hydrolase family protein [Iamia majanohamensis]WCO68298.1 dienelactone hydrolase family protein [Iamia majanohamensis]